MPKQANLLEQTLPTNTLTITYTYDSLYRLTAADYSDGTYFHYAYDEVGNRESQTTETSTNTYQYDDANRLVSVDGMAYTWDNNGNLLNDGVNTYSYDSANRLLSVTDGVSTTSYAYSGLGDRLRETVHGSTTDFTMDLNAGLTQVLSDGSYTYLYGNGRIAQVRSTGAEYFLGDALGSVRQLVNEAGEVSLAQSYQPFKSSAIRAVSQQLSPNRTQAFSIHPFLDVIEIDLVPLSH